MNKNQIRLILIVLVFMMPSTRWAYGEDSHTASTDSHHGQLAAQATDPTAPLISVRLQNYFIPKSINADGAGVNGYANVFDAQAVIPIPKMGILPRAIFRPTLPVVTIPDSNAGDSQTGLGDLAWLYIFAFDHEWGTLGIGPAGALPTSSLSSSEGEFGTNKWTLGPAIVGIFKNIPKVQYGGLIFNTWSLGGGGPESTNALSFQPILNYHFGKGWYAGMGDPAFEINWRAVSNRQVYAPLSLRLGKVVGVAKQKIDLNGQVIYNVGDNIPGKDQWGIKLTANFLFPGL